MLHLLPWFKTQSRELAVSLDEVFDKVRVIEVDSAVIGLIHLCNALDIDWREAEIEDVQVLCHALPMRALGDGDDATLSEPSQGYLCGSLAILVTDFSQHRMGKQIVAPLAERSPCHLHRTKLCQPWQDFVLLREHIGLQLIDHRLDIGLQGEVHKSASLKIGDTDGTHLALFESLLHSAIGAIIVTIA